MRRLVLLFFSLFYLMFIGCVMTYAMPADNQCNFLLELKRSCANHKITCYITVKGNKSLKAYSDQHRIIYLSTGLLDNLTREQIRSIFYHEMAHIKLGHHKIWEKYLVSGVLQAMPISEVKRLRHTQEYEADTKAAEMLYNDGFDIQLDEALEVVIPNEYRNIETNTHPATNKRLQYIKKLEALYESR